MRNKRKKKKSTTSVGHSFSCEIDMKIKLVFFLAIAIGWHSWKSSINRTDFHSIMIFVLLINWLNQDSFFFVCSPAERNTAVILILTNVYRLIIGSHNCYICQSFLWCSIRKSKCKYERNDRTKHCSFSHLSSTIDLEDDDVIIFSDMVMLRIVLHSLSFISQETCRVPHT